MFHSIKLNKKIQDFDNLRSHIKYKRLIVSKKITIAKKKVKMRRCCGMSRENLLYFK